MSKSDGNFFTLREVLDRFSAEAIRTFLLSTLYRNPIDFSPQALEQVETRVDYFYETLVKLDERLAVGKDPGAGALAEAERVESVWTKFEEAMDDDFNTADALGRLGDAFVLANDLLDKPKVTDKAAVRRSLARLRADIAKTGAVLGLWQRDARAVVAGRRDARAKAKGIDQAKVEALIVARNDARKAKDFARADVVRNELKELGVEIMDNPGGTTWKVL
jgi:cysteinyl-tRNA synthetase